MNRRKFLETSAVSTAAFTAFSFIPSVRDDKKLKIGLIGSGWYGMVLLNAALKVGGVEVVGICDVDSEHLKNSASEIEKLQGKRPKEFKNYQDLLEMKGLEAVFIGTPTHWHALQFIDACKKGLPIYCEKPLSYDLKEGIAMVEAAKKAGNIVQIGFQRRQSEAFKRVKEYMASGKAGDIHQIKAQINFAAKIGDTTLQDPPASLDWEQWCGPAPKLPYRPSIGHINWRYEKEYGNGHLFDWGIHHIDIIRKIMDLEIPHTFYSTGGIYSLKNKTNTPDTLTAHMTFSTVPLVWQHRIWSAGELTPELWNGVFFYGEKATVFATDTKMIIVSKDKGQQKEEIDIQTEGIQENHVQEFLQAVRKKDPSGLSCLVEDGFKTTASVQLAMISYYSNSVVNWDQAKKEITNNQEAAKMLKREYRGNLKHPG